jgi:hypothetical protein
MRMRVAKRMFESRMYQPAHRGRAVKRAKYAGNGAWALMALEMWLAAVAAMTLAMPAASETAFATPANVRAQQKVRQKTGQGASQGTGLVPRVIDAERFLAARGWTPGHRMTVRGARASRARMAASAEGISAAVAGTLGQPATQAGTQPTWTPLGPTAIQTREFGLVTGRVSSVAFDPVDTTGNHLYLGTTGGGVWVAENADASLPGSIVFTPLTDSVAALGGAADASISIGAITVQPGGTGVILAGTGDPNDVLDSYYGVGILRSADGGTTWTLIQETEDLQGGQASQNYSFTGEGFAGFAWSTTAPQLVVAAVSQAYEGTLVDAERTNSSYEGLYYSTDAGATWHLATIADGSGKDVQGPTDAFAKPDGNAATAVVWNPVRQLFVAAVRYHGYYQSPDGVTWTRITTQPGSGQSSSELSTALCITNTGSTGSIACPIFRGALAVNPETGDTFAWTVDLNNQDQGLWQDVCGINGDSCSNQSMTFAKQWSTTLLEQNTPQGAVTIPNGDYTLALAAVPSQQDTLLLAGDTDLWKCSLAVGCAWRNTTNSTSCMSAQVGAFQHAVVWNAANPLEIFVGNDSGIWRSTDAIAETGQPCDVSDSSHFQNLNGSLGSLAEVESMSPVITTPYTLMAGLGVNGTAGVKSTTATTDWPQILGGYGGPVAIDSRNSTNWYVNGQAGVAIYLCSQSAACTAADFGSSPVVSDEDVGGDGSTMPTPAPFLVDPLDPTQLLIGTCRVWRGPANGAGWSGSNAISAVLDSGATGVACNGDALIRSMAAMALPGGGEVVVLGMYGRANGSAKLPGHVLSAVLSPSSSTEPEWHDLTLNPVVNDSNALNAYGLDISSIVFDAHDPSGNTVYVTVEGVESPMEKVQVVYRSTDGGAHWTDLTANLPAAPANSLVVDPQNANTVYVATDQGVYFTTQVSSCGQLPYDCWSQFGTGLPSAPAVALSAAPAIASSQVLVAATYGRGIWQTPLWTAGTSQTSVSTDPDALTFTGQPFGSTSSAQTVTLKNTGTLALTPTSIAMSGEFNETDNCVNATVQPGGSCTIEITFTPSDTGALTGEMTVYANVYGGQLSVDLNGTGTAAGAVSLNPASLGFGLVEENSTSTPLTVTVTNGSGTAIPITGIASTASFKILNNACGTSSLKANSNCEVQVEFTPTQAGAVAGTLTLTDGAGMQTVALSGTGGAPPTDVLNPSLLTFTATATGQTSASQPVTLTNIGDLPLTSISISTNGQFQVTNGCGTELAAHSVCTLGVVFVPTQTGGLNGTLKVTDALHTQNVTLVGTGVPPPTLSVNPGSLNFSTEQAGVPSAPATLTVTNSGGVALANVSFAITGLAASSYSVGATTCGAVLNSGSNCTVQVTFTPAATGSIAATLAVASSTIGVAAVSVPLNGSGELSGGLGARPTQLPFPIIGVGQSSTAQLVTVTNSSSYPVSALTLSIAAPFYLVQNNCTGGLAAGASCTVGVIFQPLTQGPATGALTVSSTSVTVPAIVGLTGTGFNYSVGVAGSNNLTVASGQQADYTLTITPQGASGTFTFQCGTLPTNVLCVFNPSSETLGNGVEGDVTVEVYTGQSGSSAHVASPWGWQALPLACGLLLLPVGLWKRRKALLLAVLAAILTAGVSSCTSSTGLLGKGGPSGQGTGTNTPSGNYSIPVTVSSAGVTQSYSVKLTVD